MVFLLLARTPAVMFLELFSHDSLHCTAQIKLLKQWMACSNIMEIVPNTRSCVKLVGYLKTVHS